ncbi:MAG TPA: HAMP domain-containing sensor histidine kinase, partial [Anaeromyxobacter sp.]
EVETRRLGKLQEEFVAVVAHDLRTPLSAIQLSVKTLFVGTEPSAAQTRKVGRVFASVERITEILRALRDFTQARLAGGIPLVTECVDVGRLAQRSVAEMEGAHPGRTIQVSLEGDLAIVGDGGRLLQVLSNLLGNAIQHGPPDAPVSVTVGTEGESVALRVHNDGPPIPAALLPEIFEPFRRGTSGGEGGSLGLGLSIVREIVRAHGGTVEVRSAEGEGTTFTVRLPPAPVAPEVASDGSPAPDLESRPGEG